MQHKASEDIREIRWVLDTLKLCHMYVLLLCISVSLCLQLFKMIFIIYFKNLICLLFHKYFVKNMNF